MEDGTLAVSRFLTRLIMPVGATVAIAGIAIVTGFSIGFLFVPVVLLMICLCIQQLRSSKSRAENDPSAG